MNPHYVLVNNKLSVNLPYKTILIHTSVKLNELVDLFVAPWLLRRGTCLVFQKELKPFQVSPLRLCVFMLPAEQRPQTVELLSFPSRMFDSPSRPSFLADCELCCSEFLFHKSGFSFEKSKHLRNVTGVRTRLNNFVITKDDGRSFYTRKVRQKKAQNTKQNYYERNLSTKGSSPL